MAITRANLEAVLIKRAGKLMTVAGTNADLADPIAFSLRELGITVATLNSPTDAEVASAGADDTNQLLDVAEIRILQTVLNHVLDLVNTEAGQRADEYGQLAAGIQQRLDRLEERARRLYGWTAGTLESSYIYHDFAQHGDE
jgi:hypothetical protein